MNQSYRAGDVVESDLGNVPGEVRGHEQGFVRPCIIIRSFNNLGLATIVPCTTKSPGVPLFTIVALTKGTGDLTRDSYALCHQIRTISVDRILRSWGRLGERDFAKVQTVLLDTLFVQY
jgi:mRNA interferase MazF